jgi:hypothetical protein
MTKSQRLHQLYDPPSSSSVAAASESEETSNNNNNNEGPQPGAYAVSPGSGSTMQRRSDEVVQQQQQQSTVSVEEAEAAMAAAIEHAEQGFPGAVFYVPGDPLLRPQTSSQQNNNNNNTVRRNSATTSNTATTEDNTIPEDSSGGGSSGSSSNLMADHPDNNNNNNNMMTAHVQHLEAVALDPEEANAPSTIGIQLRSNLNDRNNNNRRRSSDLATAVISNAKVVVSGDSCDEPITIDESHPRVAYQELVDRYNRSVWTKIIVKWIVGGLIVALIGLGLGLGLTRNSSSGVEFADRPLRNWTLEGYSLQSEGYALGGTEGSQLGASSMLTVGGNSILSGSPGWNGGVGTAGLFPLSSSPSSSKDSSATDTSTTSNTTNDTSPSSSSSAAAATNTSATEAKLLIPKFESIFSGSPLPSTDHCGESISTDAFGRAFAIGCPSTSGRGYVKVFGWDGSSPPQQIGQTFYGKHVNDGFGSSVSVSGAASKATDRPDSRDGGYRLAIGSKGGYAELWTMSRVNEDFMDEWVRNDEGGILDHPDHNYSEDDNIDHLDDGEVIVTLSGAGLALYVGFPSYDNNRGIVKSFSLMGGSLVQRKDPPRHNSLEGLEEGDRFGSDIATDIQGGFAVIGTRGGGYVRAVEFVDGPMALSQFRPVGGSKIPFVYAAPPGQESRADGVSDGEEVMTEIGEDGNYGLLTVDTGRVPYKGCPQCGFEVDNRRIIVGSSKGFVVYQFVGDELLWYHIASVTSQEGDGIESGHIVDVSMSPDCRHVGVGTPSAEGGRGRLDVYRILDHADEED